MAFAPYISGHANGMPTNQPAHLRLAVSSTQIQRSGLSFLREIKTRTQFEHMDFILYKAEQYPQLLFLEII